MDTFEHWQEDVLGGYYNVFEYVVLKLKLFEYISIHVVLLIVDRGVVGVLRCCV